MLRRLSVAAALWLLMSGPAAALGLGQIQVSSTLNQPFAAVIPLTALSPDEAENLRVRLAENEDFARAGVERALYLSSMSVEAVIEGGNPRIVLRSNQLAREPLLNLLIEVKAGGPRILREYTVFLNPPAAAPATPRPQVRAAPVPQQPSAIPQTSVIVETPVVAPEPPPVPDPVIPVSEFFQTPEERVVRRPARSPARSLDPSRYGPVNAGESLSSIAEQLLGVTGATKREQIMLALYQANPGAFYGGNINQLNRGATLAVPSADTVRAIDPANARAQVQALMQGQTPPAGLAPVPPVEPVQAEPAPAAAPAAAQTPTPAPAPPAGAVEPAAAVPPPTTGSAPAAAAETAAEPGLAAGTVSTEPVATGAVAPAVAVEPPPVAVPRPRPAPRPAPEPEDNWIDLLIPALIGLILIMVGVVVWRSLRERQARKEYEAAVRSTGFMQAKPTTATAKTARGGRVSVIEELEAVDRRLAEQDTQDGKGKAAETTREMPAQAFDSTTRMPAFGGGPQGPADTQKVFAETQKVLVEPPKPAASKTILGSAEFDVTSQFQANTLQIDLGDNDPISEADFQLAYGLYDEAALLLKQAADKAPARTDLRVKLAETYFAAGKPVEFQEVAEGLRGRLDPPAWSKLAIMGRQLCPDATMFLRDAEEHVTVDLSFDDPEPVEPLELDLPVEQPSVRVDEGLEFKLEELELEMQSAAAPARESYRDEALPFDLGEFDLEGTGAAKAPAEPPRKTDTDLEFADFDLGEVKLDLPSDSGFAEIKLDDLESPAASDDPFGEDAMSAESDVGTKLDLARAYVEMGDADTAKGLLEEVEAEGNDDQKREAAKLRERLLG